MKKNQRNIVITFIITAITAFTIYALPLTGLLREAREDDIVGFQPILIFAFLLASAIFIGIPAWIHGYYIKDYGEIKNVWFFALFGGVVGAILGEVLPSMNPAELVLIIPYTIFMFIYAQFFKRFDWWKVALTTYFGGMLIENVMNRSPIQIPTLMWIAIFTYPYFYTKIWENRKEIPIMDIVKDLKWTFMASIILAGLAAFYMAGPIILLAPAISFFVTIPYRYVRDKRIKEGREKPTPAEKAEYWVPMIVVSALLAFGAAYVTKSNTSPPLILFGGVLPFIVIPTFRSLKNRKK